MDKPERPAWPTTEAGTTDWETVFESPEGLIALIRQAQSPAALRDSTVVAIRMLYTRKDDPPEVEAFVEEITSLIPDDAPPDRLPELVEAVTAILRQVKEHRTEKAREYEREQARKSARERQERRKPDPPEKRRPRGKGKAAAKDRKKAKAKPGRKPARPAKPANRKPLVIGASVAGVAVLGLVIYFIASAPDLEDKLAPNEKLIEQMTATAKGQGPKTHVFGGKLRSHSIQGRPAVTAEGLTAEVCFSVSWVLLNRGTVVVNDLMSRRMSPSIIKEMCSRATPAKITWVPKEEKAEN